MFPTATKKNDKKHHGSLDASESEEDEVIDDSPEKQCDRKEKSKRNTQAACKYLFCYLNDSIMVFL